MDKRVQALYVLAAARNFNIRHIGVISDELGSLESLLEVEDREILGLPLGGGMCQRLVDTRSAIDFGKVAEQLQAGGISLVGHGADEYPELLAAVADAPVLLFCRGKPELMRHHGIAIVGSRKCTSGGREIAAMLARDICGLGIPVVSGMALGIDGAAHEGALEEGGPTIAVLGSGIDVVYPPRHQELYERLCSEALVVSEYLPGTSPDKTHFPRRNRIISGLSRGTVVIEGSVSSGALITAREAIEQGREVFAIPGPLRSPYSKGPHHLIKNGNAQLIEGVDDILTEFGTTRAALLKERQAAGEGLFAGSRSGIQGVKSSVPVEPDADELRVLEQISYEGTHINELVRKLNQTTAKCIAHLTMLEIKGLISTASGGFYIRL